MIAINNDINPKKFHFIKLHEVKSFSDVLNTEDCFININNIASFEPFKNSYGTYAKIFISIHDIHYIVKETCEEIMKIIEDENNR